MFFIFLPAENLTYFIFGFIFNEVIVVDFESAAMLALKAS